MRRSPRWLALLSVSSKASCVKQRQLGAEFCVVVRIDRFIVTGENKLDCGDTGIDVK
jgi:hypothetical protein